MLINNKGFNPILIIYRLYKVKIIHILQSKWVNSSKVYLIRQILTRLLGNRERSKDRRISLLTMKSPKKIVWGSPKPLLVKIKIVKKYRSKSRRMVKISSNLMKIWLVQKRCPLPKKWPWTKTIWPLATTRGKKKTQASSMSLKIEIWIKLILWLIHRQIMGKPLM